MTPASARRTGAPAVARWLAGLRVPPAEREFAIGDLEEEFDAITGERGRATAIRWYWRQAVRSVVRGHPGAQASEPRSAGALMSGWFRDVRLAMRRMWVRPVVSMAAVCSFALGIGANVAIFSVAWPVLFAPLPFADEARLMKVALTFERNNATLQHPLSTGDFVDLHTASSFSQTAAFNQFVRPLNLTGAGETEQLTMGYVTPALFPVLGIAPVHGRFFTDADAQAGGVVVLSERVWRSRFGSDPSVVGRRLRLDGSAFEVIGIAPKSAGLGSIDADGWMPQWIDPGNRRRGAYYLWMVGRLAPGATADSAQSELQAVMARVAVEFPQPDGALSARVAPFRDEVAGPIRPTLILLLASAGLVLLTATVNLTGLQLARDLERGREFAVRRALGASRWHLARQALIEAFAIAVVGGAAGVAVAAGITSALAVVAPAFGWQQHVPVSSGLVAAFTMGLTCAAGVAIGLVPAWRSTRPASHTAWNTRSATAASAQTRTRMALVATQVGLTAVLLVVATLVGVSQRNVLALDPGFDPGAALAADLSVPAGRFASVSDATVFFDALTRRIGALPGVESACVANEVPLDREPGAMTYVPEGAVRPVSAWPNTITPACADVLGLRLVAGRRVTNSEASPSVMVSASMARALFPDGRSPLEQRVHFGVAGAQLLTIVGVVADIRDGTLERSHGRQVWMPQSLGHFPPRRLLVRYVPGVAMEAGPLRAVVHEMAPDVALARPRALSDVIERATASRRFALWLLSGFAVVAVLLCAIGLYGLLAHSIGQRRQEIGIRMALGARPGQVVRLVLTQVSLSVGIGMLAGLWGARALSATVRTLLFGVAATDARVYLVAGMVVLMTAALAVWGPTRRAIRIDPKNAMRAE